MTGTVPGAFTATTRYEFRMAARGRVLWFAMIPLLLVSVMEIMSSPDIPRMQAGAQVTTCAVMVNLFSTVGLAVALADRFVRIRSLGLTELLGATSASVSGRMAGTLAGALAAALAPAAGLMLVVGGVFGVADGSPSALPLAIAAFLAIIVPAALVLSTFATTLALWLPLPLARVITVVVWFWSTSFNSSDNAIPSPSGTLLSPLGDYVSAGWTGAPPFGPGPRSPQLLSPQPSVGSAFANVAMVLLITAILFGIARLSQRVRR